MVGIGDPEAWRRLFVLFHRYRVEDIRFPHEFKVRYFESTKTVISIEVAVFCGGQGTIFQRLHEHVHL